MFAMTRLKVSAFILISLFALMLAGCNKDSADRSGSPLSLKAGFSYKASKLIAPVQIEFINESENVDSYSWNFGDGSGSVEKNPKHIFTYGGLFKVTLTVYAKGKQLEVFKNIEVKDAYTKCVMKGFIIDALPLTKSNGDTWDAGSDPDLLFQLRYKGMASLLYAIGPYSNINLATLPFQPSASSFNFPSITSEYEFLVLDDDTPAMPELMGGYSFDMRLATTVTNHYPDTMLLFAEGNSTRIRLLLEWGY
jgi:hypothetical protein